MILLLLNYLLWDIHVLESFIVSFVSGAIVSLFITCVQYRKEKEDIIYYYNNTIAEYYSLLNNIVVTINADSENDNEKYDIARSFFNQYINSHRNDNKVVELNLLLNSIENKYTKKIYHQLYEYSKAVELIAFFMEPSKEKMIKLNEICNSQIKKIDDGMSILETVFEINFPWEKFKEIINSKGLDL